MLIYPILINSFHQSLAQFRIILFPATVNKHLYVLLLKKNIR